MSPRRGGRRANQTPGAPMPSIANEMLKNAQWYQSTTLSTRVSVTWSRITAAATSAIAACLLIAGTSPTSER